MKHKDKVKLANKMLSGLERELGTPKFQSKAWSKRSEARRTKEIKKRK